MELSYLRLGLGSLLSAAIAYAGYSRGSLSRSGLWGAMVVGTVIFGLGGFAWGALLVAFFVTSSMLSHYKAGEKAAIARKFSKGGRRDVWQTVANGGAGAALAVGSALHPDPMWFIAYLGSMAAVTADTWGTELGVLSRGTPRLVTNWRPVEPGTSGAISSLGTLGSVAASLCMAAIALVLTGEGPVILLIGLLAGLGGTLFDSLLGATVQGIYSCPRCGGETEKAYCHCGRSTRLTRGFALLGNDAINFLSSAFGALTAVWLYKLLS